MLDDSLQRFFWDADVAVIHDDAHSVYVIERLAELGDKDAARWMLKRYGRDTVRKTIASSRRVSASASTGVAPLALQ